MPTLSLKPTPRPTLLPTPKCAPGSNCTSGNNAAIAEGETELVENGYTGSIAVGSISGVVAVLMVALVVWWLKMRCIRSKNLPPEVVEVRHC
jgi:hypothetical protein